MFGLRKCVILSILFAGCLAGQSGPNNVSSVLPWSGTYSPSYTTGSGVAVTLPNSVLGVYTYTSANTANLSTGTTGDPRISASSAIETPGNYSISASLLQAANALNSSIAIALSVIPLASPASGVIIKNDAATGAPLPASATLGPILTERAETIGKHKFFLGVTQQSFHFTSLNGQSLNGASILSTGGAASSIVLGGKTLSTEPSTVNFGMDVRLSQDIAFLTYGVTDRLDVSVGLPMVHTAVASRTYNATLYSGNGLGSPTCWCVDTFTPGALITSPPSASSLSLYNPQIGQASMGKTGFGDVLLRVKGTVVERPNLAIALGTDLRFATGDASNYLGTGTTSVKPFMAVSLYNKGIGNVVFAPHVYVGWQFSGKSILGGDLQGTTQSVNIGGTQYSYIGAPFSTTKGFLPDVFSWAAGSEIALGQRNTIVADILGNQIGWIHGIPNPVMGSLANQYLPEPPAASGATGTASGFVSANRTSFGQYSGSFGYKVRVVGNLVLTLNALVRFDNNGLTARFVPLYGLGYTF